MNTEQSLLQRASRFDKQVLAEIYDQFSPGLYRYALRLLGDEDQAEECVAETFSRFLMALKRGSGPNQYLKAYLYRIAHNWITDLYRRQPAPAMPLDQVQVLAAPVQTAQAAAERMARERVRAALNLLTADQRQVVVLKYLEDWKNQEIADALDKPVGAVKSLQHRALGALRRLLESEEVG